jgi:hypothetical protein
MIGQKTMLNSVKNKTFITGSDEYCYSEVFKIRNINKVEMKQLNFLYLLKHFLLKSELKILLVKLIVTEEKERSRRAINHVEQNLQHLLTLLDLVNNTIVHN